MMRILAIWALGLITAAIIGGFIGSTYDGALNSDVIGFGLPFGVLAGMCAFACLRLWVAPKSNE